MPRGNRFVPAVEALERLALLTDYNMNISGFYGPPVNLDGSDGTGETAWGFPGMQFGVEVDCPAVAPLAPTSYSGLKQVTITSSSDILWPPQTTYTTTTGAPTLCGGAVVTAPSGNYTVPRAQVLFACPKDPGTVTLSIDAQCWIKSDAGPPTSWDDIHDTIKVEVEAPTVNWFVVADKSDPGPAAAPFAFDRSSGTGNSLNFDPSGTDLSFAMGSGSPLSRRWAGF